MFGLVDSNPFWYQRPGSNRLAGPWLGGSQYFGALEPDSGWHWVTAAPLGWRSWTPGQPDNCGDADAIHFGESTGIRVPTWADANGLDGAIRGIVRELSADTTTIGLLGLESAASTGYILFAPLSSRFTYLVDRQGRLVHSWRSYYTPAASVYLLENGNLLRTACLNNVTFPGGGSGGRVALINWDGVLLWSFNYSDETHCQHHDIAPLPDGNVVLLAWEYKTGAEAVAAGRNPSLLVQNKLFPDHLVEVDPTTDSIVWEWHVWDHLIQDFDSTKANYGVVREHPELIDINYSAMPPAQRGFPDWMHTNAVAYNPQLDQLVISVHNLGEIWVIDHSTTTAEARSHAGGRYGMGGDILYRWGNPRAYRAGDSLNQQFFMQHDAHWIAPGLPGAGHLLVFNNGDRRGYSTVDEIIPACDSSGNYPRPAPGTPFGPPAPCWRYGATPPSRLYSAAISGAQRLPNGNTLICEGDNGTFIEVSHDSQVVWKYINPVTDSPRLYQGETVPGNPTGKQNNTFRATSYPPEYPGLAGRNLTLGYPLERYRTRQSVSLPSTSVTTADISGISAWPNPFSGSTCIRISRSLTRPASVEIYAVDGRRVRRLEPRNGTAPWDGRDDRGLLLPRGVYRCLARTNHATASVGVTKLR